MATEECSNEISSMRTRSGRAYEYPTPTPMVAGDFSSTFGDHPSGHAHLRPDEVSQHAQTAAESLNIYAIFFFSRIHDIFSIEMVRCRIRHDRNLCIETTIKKAIFFCLRQGPPAAPAAGCQGPHPHRLRGGSLPQLRCQSIEGGVCTTI